jgi:hypothetical protein
MAIKHRRGQDKDNIVPPQEKWIGSQALFLYFKNKQQQKTHKFYQNQSINPTHFSNCWAENKNSTIF